MADSQTKQIPENFLGLPDDELMNFDPTALESAAPVENAPVEEEPEVEVPAAAEESIAPVEETADDGEDGEPAEGAAEAVEEAAAQAAQVPAEKQETPAAEKDKAPEESGIDYKAEYQRLLTPFKANGKDIAVTSVDDAISLMQMGANYTKKMAALKPNLALMKLLENNGLMSEEKISYLIDLEKKNPEAINKLIKDSGIDPLDLDAEKASAYKPGTYRVDEREVELDTVLDELQDSPAYNQTLEIVSSKWDGASKQVIAGAPQLLKVINSHVETGIYELISKEVERERMFGRLNGLSDIQAYRQVGDAIQARGGFDHLGRQGQPTLAKPVVVQPKPKVDAEKIKEKKRAAGTSKPAAAPAKAVMDFNPLSLSDDEFSKIASSQYR